MIESKDIFTFAGPTTPGRPYLNENQRGALTTSATFLADKKTLMNWIKRTPEAIGIINQIAKDVITTINFTALEKAPSKGRTKNDAGKDNEYKAKDFVKKQFVKQQLRAYMIEKIALGSGYLYKGKMNEEMQEEGKEILFMAFKEFGIELSDIELKEKLSDEDYLGQLTLQYVASSTMDIQIDKTGTKVEAYIQRTQLNQARKWLP